MNNSIGNFARPHSRSHGFSMVELMVAMTLSLLLLAGVVSIFASSKASFESVDRISRIQENGRFALDEIVRDIRSAGFNGCAKNLPAGNLNSTLNNSTDTYWDFTYPMVAFNSTGASTWSPTLPTDSGGSAVVVSPASGSDVLVLHIPKRNAVAVSLTANLTNPASALSVTNITPAPFSVNDIAMVSNCQARAYFEITGYTAGASATLAHAASSAVANTSPGNASNTVKIPFFVVGSQVIPVQTVIYFIRASASGNGNSLWRREGIAAAQELAEGIDDMELLFGEDTDNDQAANAYRTADNVADWNKVVSVRVALLVRSIDQYGSDVDTKTYTMVETGGVATTSGPYNDRRMRQVFVTTTTLRNRTQ